MRTTAPPPRVLLVSADPAIEDRLASAFEGLALDLDRRSGDEVEAAGRPVSVPAAVLLDAATTDVARVIRAGSEGDWIDPATPLVVIQTGAVEHERELEWLRAGAWSISRLPAEGEALGLQVANLVGARTAAFRPSRLYPWHTLVRVTAETLALSRRHDRPVACVAFALDTGQASAAEPGRGLVARIGDRLADAARDSDILGTSEGGVLLVLLTDTTADGGRAFLDRVVPRVRAALEELGIDGEILSAVVDASGPPPLAATELLLTAIRRVG